MTNENLISLLHLSDPSLPIGGFAHSSGLETYVQKGLVKNKETAFDFIISFLTNNVQYNDAAFLSIAYQAALGKNIDKIIEVDSLCNACKIPSQIRTSSLKLGTRLIKIFSTHMSASSILEDYKNALISKKILGHYSVTFGVYAAVLKVPLIDTLTGYYYNLSSSLVNNCIKLIPLGQQEGQEILFSLYPHLTTLVQHSLEPEPHLIGRSCPGFDIRCMQHERLYSRLYMS